MKHPHEDRLLLLAYGELVNGDAAELEGHVATCSQCRATLERLERARVALAWTLPKRRQPALWIAAGLAAAAVGAGVLLTRGGSQPETWQPPHVWSSTAGYIAGGQPVVDIDAQLTRLEQERTYVRP